MQLSGSTNSPVVFFLSTGVFLIVAVVLSGGIFYAGWRRERNRKLVEEALREVEPTNGDAGR